MIVKILIGPNAGNYAELVPKQANKFIISGLCIKASKDEEIKFIEYKKSLATQKKEYFNQKHVQGFKKNVFEANVKYVTETKEELLSPDALKFKKEYLKLREDNKKTLEEQERNLYLKYKSGEFVPKGEHQVKLLQKIIAKQPESLSLLGNKETPFQTKQEEAVPEMKYLAPNLEFLSKYGKGEFKPYFNLYFISKKEHYRLTVSKELVTLQIDEHKLGIEECELKYGENTIYVKFLNKSEDSKWQHENFIVHEGKRELKFLRKDQEIIGLKIGNATSN